jgi:glyceraldehyde 3-phosphate dehydrogenase
MTVRVAINGFGRVGRSYLRSALEREIEVVAINDLTSTSCLAHLLKYDSTYGPLGRAVDHDEGSISVDGRVIEVRSHPDPAELPWGELGVDVVIESTGRFRAREDAAAHLKAGARKVLILAPGKGST